MVFYRLDLPFLKLKVNFFIKVANYELFKKKNNVQINIYFQEKNKRKGKHLFCFVFFLIKNLKTYKLSFFNETQIDFILRNIRKDY